MSSTLKLASIKLIQRENARLVLATALIFKKLAEIYGTKHVGDILESHKAGVWGKKGSQGNGYPVLPYESLPFNLSQGAALYAIADTGASVDVRVIEINNN